MGYIRNCAVPLLALALLAGACFAEDVAPPKFFKLDFVVKEVEGGKVLNTRSYSVTVAEGKGCMFRTGSRVPVPAAGANGGSSQFNYLDVGVNIDCHEVRETPNGLSMDVNADVSSVLQEPTTAAGPPVLRQNKWGSWVLVPLKKPTLIFSSDDVTSKRQMQVELTATPII